MPGLVVQTRAAVRLAAEGGCGALKPAKDDRQRGAQSALAAQISARQVAASRGPATVAPDEDTSFYRPALDSARVWTRSVVSCVRCEAVQPYLGIVAAAPPRPLELNQPLTT